MKKTILLLSILLTLLGLQTRADDALADSSGSGQVLSFHGVVTAVDSNGNAPGHCFTAQNAEGLVKVFHISTLEDLRVGSRVELHYFASEKYPLITRTIKFLPPAR